MVQPYAGFNPENPNPSEGTTFGAGQTYEAYCLVWVTEPNYSAIFGTVPKIRAQMMQTIALYRAVELVA